MKKLFTILITFFLTFPIFADDDFKGYLFDFNITKGQAVATLELKNWKLLETTEDSLIYFNENKNAFFAGAPVASFGFSYNEKDRVNSQFLLFDGYYTKEDLFVMTMQFAINHKGLISGRFTDVYTEIKNQNQNTYVITIKCNSSMLIFNAVEQEEGEYAILLAASPLD